jgi:hypothetical protein
MKHREYAETHVAKNLFLYARSRARRLGIPFEINESDIHVPEICPVLGIKLVLNGRVKNRDSSPSLDRIVPDKGYTRDNVWVISYRANRIKNDGTPDELQKIADAVVSKINHRLMQRSFLR